MDIWGKGEEPDCKEFERMIPDFFARRLDYPALKTFYAHMERCAECREELAIQFLVTEGMQRLEEGNAFDLQSELRQRTEETKKTIRFHGAFVDFGTVMEIVAVCMMAGVVIWMLL